ncbi:unnamed protein product [Staurois parvus]|uniref:Uncharacterized protein n=1 Tax=Staurois parvus TaxID=386267 RepID=A0ABN9AU40_9NEOB|nr:unnamed protein product [Staurois parvus]
MQSGKYHSLATAKSRHVYWIARQRSMINQSREHSALESRGNWLSCFCSQLLALCYNTTNS